MRYISKESGVTFSTTVLILGTIGFVSVYGIYLCQKLLNESRADEILNNVFEMAQQEKDRIDSKDSTEEDTTIVKNYRREGKRYRFRIKEGATSTLIKVETEKQEISKAVCKALQQKFSEDLWWGVFKKVVVIDRLGEEKTDVLAYDCPHGSIPSLRFYVEFPGDIEPEVEIKEDEPALPEMVPVSMPVSAPVSAVTPVRRTNTSSTSYNKPSCPLGTSSNGAGGIAVAGCRCNNSEELWNGKICEVKVCPEGSSRSASKGDKTNVAGCRCKDETPIWYGSHCVKKCSGDKVLSADGRDCVCPNGTVEKENSHDLCVECNDASDCFSEHECINNKCIGEIEDYNDCRWGICQTCDKNNVRKNITEPHACEVAGLPGLCNGNGTCYPTKGRHCSSMKGCPSGFFCNYGGKYNSNKKQKGKFGQTPDVCQSVDPQEFTYKDKTYYYNSKKDLKSWCRAANNTANCKWGYLSKQGAESWCASLEKRLLTRSEMSQVWDVLKKELPQTYTGYAYWLQEGIWLEDKKGGRSFGKGRPDGYGGMGGVVCK